MEVPDVAKALEALEQAPLVRMVADPAVRDLLGALGQGERFDVHPRESLVELLDSACPGKSWATDLDSVRAVSASLRWPDGASGPEVRFALELSDAETAQRMEASLAARGAAEFLGPYSDFLWQAEPNVSTAVEGSYLLCTASGAEGVAAVVEGDGVSTWPLWEAGSQLLGSSEGVRLVTALANRPLVDLLERIAQSQGQPLPEIPSVVAECLEGSLYVRTDMRGQRFVTQTYAPDSAQEEAATPLFGSRSIDTSWLQAVSTDNMAVFSTAINGAELARQMRQLLAPLGNTQDEIAAFEKELGFSLDELFGQLGPNVLGTMDGLSGIGLPKTFAWVEVRDPELFQERMGSFVENAGTQVPGLAARSRDYKFRNAAGERVAYPVTTLTLPPEVNVVPMLGLSPAYTIAEGRLLFGLNSMHVKRELKRLFGADAAEAGGADPFARQGVELQEGTHTAFLMDWGLLVTGVLDLARAFGGMAGDSLPFDVNALPKGDLFAKYLEPTVHVARRVEGGLVREHRSSFGPEILLAVAELWLAPQAMSGSIPVPIEPAEPPAEPIGSGGRVR